MQMLRHLLQLRQQLIEWRLVRKQTFSPLELFHRFRQRHLIVLKKLHNDRQHPRRPRRQT